MEFRAEARFVRLSPQKARLVLELIKGRQVEDALHTLAFTNKGAAPIIQKVLRSALENANYLSAEKGLDVDVDRLMVLRAVANDVPRLWAAPIAISGSWRTSRSRGVKSAAAERKPQRSPPKAQSNRQPRRERR